MVVNQDVVLAAGASWVGAAATGKDILASDSCSSDCWRCRRHRVVATAAVETSYHHWIYCRSISLLLPNYRLGWATAIASYDCCRSEGVAAAKVIGVVLQE
ncbi:uncharacterized protein LOC130950954 [Arachis stenosperma]|uniref:uncharacterized protein LOC130950954 n=1 Tax=Arachis stenosperma TaxID=217475 RepID=UPI0025ACCABD|nr:uncharacterized protein LOC130950954 [Arachis stenosperma]